MDIRGRTLLAATVCFLYAVYPLPRTGQWCYESVEAMCMLVSDAFLCFP